MFFGREQELHYLNEKYRSKKSELLVIYGRRRIGKSSLIDQFAKPRSYLKFEGIEGERTDIQISMFSQTMSQYLKDPFIQKINFESWEMIFQYLTDKIINNKKREKKLVVLFDEIQWMAVGRGKLISIIKYFWDNHWKKMNVLLILCGSIASFMVKKIINSKSLYGRINGEVLLKGLKPNEASLIFKSKRCKEEILKYQLIFGGVPKYLEEINLSQSFNRNMNSICFNHHSLMLHEVHKIFYSQFKEVSHFRSIVHLLKNSMCSLKEISDKLKIKSGGTLKNLLQQLIDAEFADILISFDQKWNTKFKKYRLSDEFLNFYYRYMEPNLRIIRSSNQQKNFEKLTQKSLSIWLGFAFERFCLKHADYLAKIMGFDQEMLYAGPHFQRNDHSFQIDLLYKRTDNVIVLCEIKYLSDKIGTTIIPEIEKKCRYFNLPKSYTLEKALISVHGPDQSLLNSEYFHYHVTLDDIIPD